MTPRAADSAPDPTATPAATSPDPRSAPAPDPAGAQDSGRLTKIPGIGKKTAERLLLELRDKLDAQGLAMPAAAASEAGSDIVNALLALGYNDREAGWAVKQLPADTNVTDGIRQALKLLSRQ